MTYKLGLFHGKHGEFHEEEMDLLFLMDLCLWLSVSKNIKKKQTTALFPFSTQQPTQNISVTRYVEDGILYTNQESNSVIQHIQSIAMIQCQCSDLTL